MGIVVAFPAFPMVSWKDSSCNNIAGEYTCVGVSDNFEQPFCVTNFYRNGANDVDNASSCILPALTNSLSIDNSNVSMRDLVKNYCHSLFWKSDGWRIYFAKFNNEINDFDWQQTFDSHQSLFLYALCSSFKEKDGKMPFVPWNVLLSGVYKWDLTKLLKLQQKSKWKDLCSLEDNPSLNGCDFSIYVTKIFGWIMSDLFKIKYSQVLHVDTNENFDGKKKVEEFMSGYFLISEWYDKLKKNYSKTVSILESDQKYYKDVLNSLKIIDNIRLSNESKKSWCWIEKNIKWLDFVACALHESQWKWPSLTPAFVTLLYNELLNYRYFISYFVNARRNEGKDDVAILKKYSDMQIEAFNRTEHDLEDFNRTYPLHIWVLLYTEKVEKFRNNKLSKVITLFYSLSEKLQNVQEPTS